MPSQSSAGREGDEIRVRMGLHLGAPNLTEEGYVGEDVHRAARIAALAAGGQILLSESLAEVARKILRWPTDSLTWDSIA